jgi:hypothetical protein
MHELSAVSVHIDNDFETTAADDMEEPSDRASGTARFTRKGKWRRADRSLPPRMDTSTPGLRGRGCSCQAKREARQRRQRCPRSHGYECERVAPAFSRMQERDGRPIAPADVRSSSRAGASRTGTRVLASGWKRVRERKTGCSPVPLDVGMAGACLWRRAGSWPLQMPVPLCCAAGISIARATRPRAVPARVAHVQFPQPRSDEHGWIRAR